MKKTLEVFYFGYGILILAALINWLGKYLNMKSWYDLFGAINFSDLSLVNMFWLVIVYPFLLGISLCLLNKYKKIVNN